MPRRPPTLRSRSTGSLAEPAACALRSSLASTKYRSSRATSSPIPGRSTSLLALGTRAAAGRCARQGVGERPVAQGDRRAGRHRSGHGQAPASRGAGATHRSGPATAPRASLRSSPRSTSATSCPAVRASYAQLAWHLFNVVDAFLEHEQGIPLSARRPTTGCLRPASHGPRSWPTAPMSGAGSMPGGRARRRGRTSADKASVYYGDVSRHEFLERTTWHAGQHSAS